ncbi:hypothetical protein AAMO2058_000032600 [Amorphochlora amoebiformis]
MSSQGATLQNYNNELVKCLEDLREKREILNKERKFHSSLTWGTTQILREEKKKQDIQKHLHKLSEEVNSLAIAVFLPI